MSPTESPPEPHRKSLTALPRDLLARVAFHTVVDDNGDGQHPHVLLPLFLSCRTIYQAISFDNNLQLYKDLYNATFDYQALSRRYKWMAAHIPKNGRKVFNLFEDPRAFAIDYKTRWDMSWRMQQVAKHGQINIPGVCSQETYVEHLWTVWFMITEHDGKNMQFVLERCEIRKSILTYYRDKMLRESLLPGYPTESGEKALAAWCCIYAGIDSIGESTPEEVDEKIFVLRPYVFACAKYDVSYAPWHIKSLPLCNLDCKVHPTDAVVRSRAMTYKRFGYSWRRAPPPFVLAAYIMFLRLLERQPDRIGLRDGSTTFAHSPFELNVPDIFSNYKTMLSPEYDEEWQRNTMCQDPHVSQGLPALAFRGSIEGFWRGKFLFHDFALYRDILAGNMRGVYTGMFAEQATELELKETVIKVKKEELGGDGPLLLAGFKEGENMEEDVAYAASGYGHELAKDDDEDEEGWTKEIILTGKCRTCWGWAKVRGRVRAWDGLVILCFTYGRDASAKWLWRGYLHTGGYLVGRWRDTFTPENLRGYEGAFGLIRAGSTLYPDHFPKRMEDSLGVNQSAHTNLNIIGLPPLLPPETDSPVAQSSTSAQPSPALAQNPPSPTASIATPNPQSVPPA